MPAQIAGALVTLVTAYVGAGVLFALFFIVAGAGRIDARVAGAGWGFRILILPGSTLLWPVLALKWIRTSGRSQ